MDGDAERPTEAVAALFLDESDPVLVANTDVAPGTSINGYVVEGQIGKGATGLVYSATHPTIGKRVAIKVLRHDLCDDASSVARFVLEARAVNEIQHPNIIDIFDLGALPDGRSFLIMDLLVGRTLRKRLAEGPLPVHQAAAVIDDCASALIAAHDKGFAHRDLKPDNIFLVEVPDRRPDVRLLDFGVVKLLADTHPSGIGVKTRLGAVIGTPQYMSPEQARAKDVDHRTDIYALGVMSFELLAGRRPFERKNTLDLLIAHAEAPIPSLRERVPSIPVEVAQLVESMMAKRAADRPTLAAVRTVIKRLVGTVIPTFSGSMPSPPDLTAAPIAQSTPRARAASPVPAAIAEVETAQLKRREELGATLPFQPRAARPAEAVGAAVAGAPASAGSTEARVQPSAAIAMTAMPAYVTTPVSPSTSSPSPSLPSLPKVVPKGTPSKTQQVPEVAIVDEALEPARSGSKLWILFAVAAILVIGGGLVLGMSL